MELRRLAIKNALSEAIKIAIKGGSVFLKNSKKGAFYAFDQPIIISRTIKKEPEIDSESNLDSSLNRDEAETKIIFLLRKFESSRFHALKKYIFHREILRSSNPVSSLFYAKSLYYSLIPIKLQFLNIQSSQKFFDLY